jgi:uncharacterized protein YjbI with pentapeptide repeats
MDAHLQDAHLEGADLKRAMLRGAHLERANLREAHIEGANLDCTHLEGAYLKTIGLTEADLEESASGDDRTVLPAGFRTRPVHWSSAAAAPDEPDNSR